MADLQQRRIYAMSDLHTHHEENYHLLQDLLREHAHLYRGQVAVCAGDVASDMERLADTLSLLVQCFSEVFFCPGNNELRLLVGFVQRVALLGCEWWFTRRT
jgi:predicted MPP superfamily phosphohydrolase